MNKRFNYFITVFFICTAYMGFSQTKIDTVYIKYLDAANNTVKDSASYYRVRTISNGILKAEDYSMKDGILKCSGHYKQFDPYIKEGSFVDYLPSLNAMMAVGRSEGNYVNDKKEGVWTYYYSSGEVWYTEIYAKGTKNGTVKAYYKTGEVKRIEEYENDKRVTGKCYTKSGKDTAYYEMQIMPSFPGGPQALAAYISSRIIYPEHAKINKIQGIVYVWYVVNTDGSISDVEIVKGKGVHPSLDNEAIRCVKSMPTLTPGSIDGTPVKVKMIQKIKFSLTQ